MLNMITYNNWYRCNFFQKEKKIKANIIFENCVSWNNWKQENLNAANILLNEAKKLNRELVIIYSGGSDSTITAASFVEINIYPKCIMFVPYVSDVTNYEIDTIKNDFIKNFYNLKLFHNQFLTNPDEFILGITNLEKLNLPYELIYLDIDYFIKNNFKNAQEKYPCHHPEYSWQIFNKLNLKDLDKKFLVAASGDPTLIIKNKKIFLLDRFTKLYEWYAWSKNSNLVGTPFFPMFTKEQRMSNLFDEYIVTELNKFKDDPFLNYSWNTVKIKMCKYYFPNVNFTFNKTICFPFKEDFRKKIVNTNFCYAPKETYLHLLQKNKKINYEV